jgi:hypothetical protein
MDLKPHTRVIEAWTRSWDVIKEQVSWWMSPPYDASVIDVDTAVSFATESSRDLALIHPVRNGMGGAEWGEE